MPVYLSIRKLPCAKVAREKATKKPQDRHMVCDNSVFFKKHRGAKATISLAHWHIGTLAHWHIGALAHGKAIARRPQSGHKMVIRESHGRHKTVARQSQGGHKTVARESQGDPKA